MIDFVRRTGHRHARRAAALILPLLVCSLGLAGSGCDALNPAFLEIVAPDGTLATMNNAPGHVVIAFVNNAEIDERVISYLESAAGGGLEFTDAEKQSLRPRVRARVVVTFRNGQQSTIEFVDGTPDLIEPIHADIAVPDLNQNDLDHVVVLCDVARVELVPSSIEVFIPVELAIWEWETTSDAESILEVGFWRVRGRRLPSFWALRVDGVDANRNLTVRRNLGIRDVPAPVDAPLCGSVVTIVMDGTLSVPFLDGVDDSPSYDMNDAWSVGAIGGRYEFIVSVQ